MAIYNKSGEQIFSAYELDGDEISTGYDVAGNIVYTSAPIQITAMSFNVGCFYTQYFPCPNAKTEAFYQRHRTIFGNQEADLCGMQEWNNAIGTISASVLMNEFFDDTKSSYVYPAVQTAALTMGSKYTISNLQLVQYQDQDANVRYYQKAYVSIGGKTVCFVNTHLGTSTIRNSQMVELLNMLENEEYFVAFGDFNFRIETVGDSEYNLSVALALARGFHSAQNASGIYLTGYRGETVASSTSTTALDNIITSGNIDISNVHIDTTKFTDGLCEENEIIIDHVPIIATLTIN